MKDQKKKQDKLLSNMKFLVSITTLILVFAMNRFHEDHFKDANNFFIEIVYKNTTEQFHVKREIRKFIKSFEERQKIRTRSLNEIECTKTFYEYIKEGFIHNPTFFETYNHSFLDRNSIEMVTNLEKPQLFWKIKENLKLEAESAFREMSLCEKSFMIIRFTSTCRIENCDLSSDGSQKILRTEISFELDKNSLKFLDRSNQIITLTKIDNLMKTREEKKWELTGKHFLNTLYVLILIFVFKSRFYVIIDFNCQDDDGASMLVRFQIIRIHYKLDLVTLNLVTRYELVAIF